MFAGPWLCLAGFCTWLGTVLGWVLCFAASCVLLRAMLSREGALY